MNLEVDIQMVRGAFRLQVACRIDDAVTGVFGPSGAGKTSFLHALAGLLRPDKGRIALGGNVLFDDARGVSVPAHKRRIAIVFQDGRLLPHYTVAGNLRYAQRLARAAGLESPAVDPARVVELLDLGELLDRRPSHLSGGETRRVALGRALLAQPRLLLLDEPLAGLDHARKEYLLPFLRQVQEATGTPMMMVSHDLADILHLTDRLLVLRGGQVLGQGSLFDLVQQPDALAILRGAGLMNVLRLRVREHRIDWGITILEPEAQPGEALQAGVERTAIKVPLHPELAAGAPTWAMLRPEDIALALESIAHISIQNQLRGRIERVVRTESRTLCLVNVGAKLLVDVTHLAVADMALAEGKTVWCLFKAHAVSLGTARRTSSPPEPDSHASPPGEMSMFYPC
jgi:molybdate transport system ATP-binding protein